MKEKEIVRAEEVIEPEILDENGRPIYEEEKPKDAARPKGDMGGIVSGFFVLAFGFLVTLFVAAFSILIVLPLMLLGRILGFQIRTFKH